ncbi:HTH-type transcriptional regulator Xre [Lachnospiraceae bacterium]|nr:HTH-type transcriptional regulator Xre [Lachnospiraceae bacterium]
MNFGEKLYRLRVERGIYQKQLAAYLHVSVGTISNYENGIHSPDLKTLSKLASYFRVSADYLLDRTDYVAPHRRPEHGIGGPIHCRRYHEYHSGTVTPKPPGPGEISDHAVRLRREYPASP